MKQGIGNNVLNLQFEKLYQSQSDAIFRYCLFRVSDREIAIDLAQDAFTKYWDAISNGKEVLNDRAFLFMIARNLIIDLYRKKKSVSLDAILEENEDHMFMAGGIGKESIEMSTEARFVLDKINELEPSHQQIIYLRFVEDLKPKEIAEVLDISSNAVSVRILRGIEKLRELTGYDIKEK